MFRHLPQPLVVHKHNLQSVSVGVYDRLVTDGAPENVRPVIKREGVLHKLLEDHAIAHAFAKAVQHVDYVKLGKGRARGVASLDAFSNATRRRNRYNDDAFSNTARRRNRYSNTERD